MEFSAKKYDLIKPMLVLVLLLLVIETALEIRHYLRCYNTPILGQKDCSISDTKTGNSSAEVKTVEYGPIPNWPYRSVIPKRAHPITTPGDISLGSDMSIIWIASSSHAEHSRLPPDRIFPNKICESVRNSKDSHCLVVNGSRAGDSIKTNLMNLENAPFVNQIEQVVLYQMAIFLAREQNRVNGKAPVSAQGLDYFKEQLGKVFQSTSVYSHLSEYIGSTVKLASFRRADLEGADIRWTELLKEFIDTCNALNIEPVLTTFAAAYDISNIANAPTSLLRTLVRENNTLSPSGYVGIIDTLNTLTKSIAKEHNIVVIDIAETVGGQPALFVDMVHFSPKGHDIVADTIGKRLRLADDIPGV